MKKLKISFLIFVIIFITLVVTVEIIMYVSYNFSNLSQIKLPPTQIGKIKLAFTPKDRFPQPIPFIEEFSTKTRKDFMPKPLTKELAWALVEEFAPIIIHEKGRKPAEDVPISVTFDEDENSTNNKINFDASSTIYPSVYGELTAETSDSYYLTYIFYHITDYDHPFREFLFTSTYHEHDLEGLHIRVDKNLFLPVEAETWFHNRFFYCGDPSPEKSQKGKPFFYLNLYKNKNPLIFVLKEGHGVRCAQKMDFIDLDNKFVFFPLFEKSTEPINKKSLTKKGLILGYQLENMDIFLNKIFSKSFFKESIVFFILTPNWIKSHKQKLYFGRFLASHETDKFALARPKPPWSWDGLWDDQHVGEFYFDPALSFERQRAFHYFSYEKLSLSYIHHYSISKIFKKHSSLPSFSGDFYLTSDEDVDEEYVFFRTLMEGTNKLQAHPKLVKNYCREKRTVKCFFMKVLRRYINFLFLTFGEA